MSNALVPLRIIGAKRRAFLLVAPLFFFGVPFCAQAQLPQHNSILALLIPQRWREALYSLANWGELDLIPNTIFVILATTVAFVWLTRRLGDLPMTRGQNAVEWLVEGLNNTFGPPLGENGRKYLPFVNSFFVFILVSNLTGLLPGFQAPTAEWNTTIALALTSILAVQGIAIRELGLKGYLLDLCVIQKPFVLGLFLFPVEIITQLARVLSLSLRLFVNIFAKEVVIFAFVDLGVKTFFIPWQVPLLFLAILASLIQAFIFSILSAVYIGQFLEHAHHNEGHPVMAGAHGDHA